MGMGGSPPPPPAAQAATSTTSEFPDELKPYIEDILERAKTRAESRDEAGFQVFPGPRLADFTPEQQAAQQGITGLVNAGLSSDPTLASAKTYMAPAFGATLASQQSFTPAAAQQFMSPYMQSVVDIQKREAERKGSTQRQDIATQGAASGGFGGSRQAILESEQRRNEAQLLSDIQKTGSQSAFEQAAGQFERERARNLSGGQQFAGLAELAPRLATAELGALSGVGAQKQQQDQRATDIAYQQFLEEEQYPERVLQEYSSIIRGFPLTPNVFGASQQSTPPPNLATQVAGLVGAGASGFKAFGNEGGGIASLPLKKVPAGNKGLQALKKKAPNVVKKMGFAQAGQTNIAEMTTIPFSQTGMGPSPINVPPLQGLQSNRKALKDKITELLAAQAGNREKRKESTEQDKALGLMQGFLKMAQAGGEGKGIVDGLVAGSQVALPDIQAAMREGRGIDSEMDAEALKLATLQGDISGLEFAENLEVKKLLIEQENSFNDRVAALGKGAFEFSKAMNSSIDTTLGDELKLLFRDNPRKLAEIKRQALEYYAKSGNSLESMTFFEKQLASFRGRSGPRSSIPTPTGTNTGTPTGTNAGSVINRASQTPAARPIDPKNLSPSF
tara:strand:+ start:4156 stop:6009 length:1854 start_codon:yes stop_codon:yes gene_type:complete